MGIVCQEAESYLHYYRWPCSKVGNVREIIWEFSHFLFIHHMEISTITITFGELIKEYQMSDESIW